MTWQLHRRHVLTLACGTGLGTAARAAGSATNAANAAAAQNAAQELTADEARADLRLLQRGLIALHPGLLRYAGRSEIDARFAAAEAATAGGANPASILLLASNLAAAVRCGHTWANPFNQGPSAAALLARGDKLPVTLRWAEGRALVTASMARGVLAGDELLAIDGRPMAQVAQALLPLVRADGSSDVKRWAQLDSGANGGAMDRLYPLLSTAANGSAAPTRARLRTTRTEVEVPLVTLAERDRQLPPLPDDWRFEIRGDTGWLTLPTFAFWRGGFDWQGFITRTFEALEDVPYLVIDQRDNEGGDDAIGRRLMSHLVRAPLQLPAQRVESSYERVPYELARYLDTWDFSFFDRTGQVRKGDGRNWIVSDRSDAAPAVIEPVARPYRGRTVLLVGPDNSSAGFVLARDAQRAGAAVLVGRTTGGNLRGLNGGQLAWLTLPRSQVAVDIPLLAHVTAGSPPDRGVLPDVNVPQRYAELQAGHDADAAAATRLIAGWRTR